MSTRQGAMRAVLAGAAALCSLMLGGGPLAAAERHLNTTERFPVTSGKRVVVDAGTLDVRLRGADLAELVVVTDLHIAGVGEHKAETWIADHTPAAADDDAALHLTVPAGGSGFLGLGYLTARAELGIVTPTLVAPDLTTTSGAIHVRGDFPLADPLMLRSAGGGMIFEGATRAVDIRSTGGHAIIHVFRPLESLFARTSSGGVTLEGGARRVHVDTASGDVSLANLSGAADVQTTTGTISLAWDRLEPDASVSVRSSSGRVELAVPPGVSPQGTLTTTTGTIRCELPGTLNERGDAVALAGDGPTIQVETASAEIVLRVRSDLLD